MDDASETLVSLYDLLENSSSDELAFQAALEHLLSAVSRSAGVLFIQTNPESEPEVRAQTNLSPSWQEQVAAPDSPIRQLVRAVTLPYHSHQSQAVSGRPSSGRETNRQPLLIEDLAVAVPIRHQDQVLGVILIEGPKCSYEDRLWLERLALPIGHKVAAQNVQTIANERARLLADLQLLITQFDPNSSQDELQNHLIEGLCQLLDTEGGAMALIDEDSEDFIIKKTIAGKVSWKYQGKGAEKGGLVSECVRKGETALINNPSEEQGFHSQYDSVAGEFVSSLLCVPLQVREQKLGAILMVNKRHRKFNLQDQQMLGVIADLAAQTIYGNRLIQQHKVANADLEASRWELLHSRNTLRALFDSMPAALYIINRQYNLIALNMSSANRAGERPNMLVGRKCYQALYQRQDICPGCRVSETLAKGRITNRIERRNLEEEEASEWDINSYPIYDEVDEVVQAILLEQDVTEKRRLESTLAQSEKLAAVGQLAAGVAHEINNPLTAIIANAQLMQREVSPDNELYESLDLIARAGARAAHVVRNLLDFARKERYQFLPTDVNETIKRAISLVQHELLARSITLDYLPQADLPLVPASQDQIQGVWLNLLLNAIDSIEHIHGLLQVKTYLSDNFVAIAISDNGKGIPPDRLARIFEPFFTTKAIGRGTGLGLSVCDRIIKQHGGRILVESEIDKGTCFTVLMPAGSH
jgi:two-component system, NtrC family, sensor kinase